MSFYIPDTQEHAISMFYDQIIVFRNVKRELYFTRTGR